MRVSGKVPHESKIAVRRQPGGRGFTIRSWLIVSWHITRQTGDSHCLSADNRADQGEMCTHVRHPRCDLLA
jgi:hypothetical protein